MKRWFIFSVLGLCTIAFGVLLIVKAHPVTFLFNLVWDLLSWIADVIPPTASGVIAICLGAFFLVFAFFQAGKQVLNLVAPDESSLIDALDRHHMEGKGIKIVAIGGGTGLSNMLRGLKSISSNITAVVTVADDGGSSGRLRESMDIVPPGDIRSCIAALARDDEVITRLFQYRFDNNASADLKGHSFGNLFLTGLVELGGSKNMADAVKNACDILRTRGQVLPVSNEPMYLKAEFSDGNIVSGESNITEANGGKIVKMTCDAPAPTVLPDVLEAIAEADLIVFGPGSLYTSIIPNLLVPGMIKALKEAAATKVYVCNVMTQPGETEGYSISDHVAALIKHSDGENLFNYVVANDEAPNKTQREKYLEKNQVPVELDEKKINEMGVKLYTTNLLQKGNMVRHNFRRLTKALLSIYKRDQRNQDKRRRRMRKKAIKSGFLASDAA